MFVASDSRSTTQPLILSPRILSLELSLLACALAPPLRVSPRRLRWRTDPGIVESWLCDVSIAHNEVRGTGTTLIARLALTVDCGYSRVLGAFSSTMNRGMRSHRKVGTIESLDLDYEPLSDLADPDVHMIEGDHQEKVIPDNFFNNFGDLFDDSILAAVPPKP